jgi:uncharacterized protein YfdQ (DUF2303 family)
MSQMNTKTKRNGKISQVSYRKSYTTFAEGLKDCCSVNTKIDHLFSNEENNEEEYTVKKAYDKVVDLICTNTPNPDTRENTLWEFFVSANSVNIKTNQFLGFGWHFKNIPNKEGMTVDFYITLYGKSDKEVEKLVEAGFEEVN